MALGSQRTRWNRRLQDGRSQADFLRGKAGDLSSSTTTQVLILNMKAAKLLGLKNRSEFSFACRLRDQTAPGRCLLRIIVRRVRSGGHRPLCAPEVAARVRCDRAHPRDDVSRPATSE